MSETLEEHEANGPETWQVVKAGERLWHLTDAHGVVLESRPTRRAAAEDKVSGFHVKLWADRLRWMHGESVRGWKPYAQVVAEREANDRAQAQCRAFRQAGYERVQIEEAGKRCCGGREELPADHPAWQDREGWLWCRMHLAALVQASNDERNGS